MARGRRLAQERPYTHGPLRAPCFLRSCARAWAQVCPQPPHAPLPPPCLLDQVITFAESLRGLSDDPVGTVTKLIQDYAPLPVQFLVDLKNDVLDFMEGGTAHPKPEIEGSRVGSDGGRRYTARPSEGKDAIDYENLVTYDLQEVAWILGTTGEAPFPDVRDCAVVFFDVFAQSAGKEPWVENPPNRHTHFEDHPAAPGAYKHHQSMTLQEVAIVSASYTYWVMIIPVTVCLSSGFGGGEMRWDPGRSPGPANHYHWCHKGRGI